MKKQSFFSGTILLIIGGFFAKIVGALYKIPLTNIIGSEGIGMYYLVFPLYNLLLVMCSSGVGLSVTKLVAKEPHKNNRRKIFISGMLISITLSVISACIVVLLSKRLSVQQGEILPSLGFVLISPAIVISSLIAISKSYFQGIQNMFPSTLAMISEQLLKMIFGILFTLSLVDKGITYAVLGAIFAVTISEGITLIFLWLYVVVTKERKSTSSCSNVISIKKVIKLHNKSFLANMYANQRVPLKVVCKRVLSEVVPNTLIFLVSPIATFLDSFLIIKLLIGGGYSSSVATCLYGINSGVVATLIALPVIITSAISTALVPNLSGEIEVCNNQKKSDKISFFIKITWVVILPICAIFIIFSKDMIVALYNFSSVGEVNELAFAVQLLRVSSISIIYSALMSTLVAIIQSLEKTHRLFIVLCVCIGIRFFFLIVFIQYINIFSVVVANTIYYTLVVIVSICLIKSKYRIKFNPYRLLIIPIVSVITAVVVTNVVILLVKNIWLRMIIGGGAFVVIYLLMALILRVFNEEEIAYIPILRKLYITTKNGYYSQK